MKSSLTTSPLIRLLLRGIWCIALVAAPFSMPGLAPTGDGLEWVAPLYGALAAACVYLSTPLMGLAMLAGIDLYHVANLAGHGPQLTLYASLAAVALLLAWRDLLLAPPAPWLPAGLRAALRPAMLPLTLLASLPLYFQLCAPWPSLLLAPWCLLLWASMPRRRALLTELLAACAGAALALTLFGLVSEAGARMLFAPHPPNHLLRPHPTRIVDLVPNAYGVFSFQEFQCPPFRAAISAQGIRDRYFGPKPAGVRRVLAIGDSTTFGWGVALEETLPRQLEAVLQQREGAAAVEVINAGTPTYGPWQTLDWLKERGADFEPDAVLFTLFPVNDPGNELYRAGRQLKCYTPEAIAATRRYERALFWPERIDRWLHLHSRFYQLAIHAHPQRQHHVLTALSQLRAMQGDLFPAGRPPAEPQTVVSRPARGREHGHAEHPGDAPALPRTGLGLLRARVAFPGMRAPARLRRRRPPVSLRCGGLHRRQRVPHLHGTPHHRGHRRRLSARSHGHHTRSIDIPPPQRRPPLPPRQPARRRNRRNTPVNCRGARA
jgi:hypothetical protein